MLVRIRNRSRLDLLYPAFALWPTRAGPGPASRERTSHHGSVEMYSGNVVQECGAKCTDPLDSIRRSRRSSETRLLDGECGYRSQ